MSKSPYAEARETAKALQQYVIDPPRVAIVLGTGLGGVVDAMTSSVEVPYMDVPHVPRSSVEGHAGRFVFGVLGGISVACMQGRFHLYEGYTPAQVVLPLRALHLLGAETLIVTNAAGGMNPDFAAGDLMLVTDHIGLPTLAGANPLVGLNDEAFGPRFPSMTDAYDPGLRHLAHRVAEEHHIRLRHGVYAMVSGPNYESLAELRFLRLAGADAVGMSTVPEVIAARHMGMRVLAISCITNMALPTDTQTHKAPSHAEVLAVAAEAGAQLSTILAGVAAHF